MRKNEAYCIAGFCNSKKGCKVGGGCGNMLCIVGFTPNQTAWRVAFVVSPIFPDAMCE